jgi:hypothetical protein
VWISSAVLTESYCRQGCPEKKRADSRGEPARSQCDQWEASGHLPIHDRNMGESLLCSSVSVR